MCGTRSGARRRNKDHEYEYCRRVGCPTVDNLSGSLSLASYLRWAPEGVHVDSWECRTVTVEEKLSKTVLVAEGCEVTVPVLSVPDHYSKSPGQVKNFRNQLGWSTLLRTETSGVWVFWGDCGVSRLLLRLYRRLTGLIEACTAQHGRWIRAAAAHIRMGAGQQSGRKPESAPGSCSEVCGGQSLP